MKAYLAGPIFTPEQINVMASLESTVVGLGFETFSPYRASREIWRGRKPADCTPAERHEVLRNNVTNMNDSDVLLAWINGTHDGRVDTGVAWEMGYTQAMRQVDIRKWRPSYRLHFPVTIGYIHAFMPLPQSGLNLMLAGTMDAVVTSSAEVKRSLELVNTYDPSERIAALREMFDPERHSLHETVEIQR